MSSYAASPGVVIGSFRSKGSSRRNTPSVGSSDIDQVELVRLRAENQKNMKQLAEERRANQELSRRVAELERDLDRLKIATANRKQIDVSIPRYFLMGPNGPVRDTVSETGSNASFQSTTLLGITSASSSRSSSPRGDRTATEPDHSRPEKPYIAFLITVQRGFPHPPGRKAKVLRRFTNFKTLHKALVKQFSSIAHLIPDLPEKVSGALFSKTLTTAKEVAERRRSLEIYLRQLLCIDEVRSSELMESFLATDALTNSSFESEEALIMEDPF